MPSVPTTGIYMADISLGDVVDIIVQNLPANANGACLPTLAPLIGALCGSTCVGVGICAACKVQAPYHIGILTGFVEPINRLIAEMSLATTFLLPTCHMLHILVGALPFQHEDVGNLAGHVGIQASFTPATCRKTQALGFTCRWGLPSGGRQDPHSNGGAPMAPAWTSLLGKVVLSGLMLARLQPSANMPCQS